MPKVRKDISCKTLQFLNNLFSSLDEMAVGNDLISHFKYWGSRHLLKLLPISCLVITEKKRMGKVPHSASLFF